MLYRLLVLAETYGATTLLSTGETRVIESDNIATKIRSIRHTNLQGLSLGFETAGSLRSSRSISSDPPDQAAARISFENVRNLALDSTETDVRVQFSVFKDE